MDREKVSLEISNRDEQFAISFELLCLLRWIVEHDADKLKKIVDRAVRQGLHEQLQKIAFLADADAYEEAQDNMVEFFSSLETILQESIQEKSERQAIEKNLIPAIEHIDIMACDDHVVQESLVKAHGKLTHNAQENPKDILLKEILRNWKPLKKSLTQ